MIRHLIHGTDFLCQRLSKDFHDQLEINTACSRGSIKPERKVTLRPQLKELCFQQGLFIERDIKSALE